MGVRTWRHRFLFGSSLPIVHARNLEVPPWCYVLWGVPALIASVSSYAYGHSLLTVTLSVAWIGIGCFLNGRSCGRVHCLIDGVGFPALAVVGALGVLSVVAMSWGLFWLAFFAILAVSFAA